MISYSIDGITGLRPVQIELVKTEDVIKPLMDEGYAALYATEQGGYGHLILRIFDGIKTKKDGSWEWQYGFGRDSMVEFTCQSGAGHEGGAGRDYTYAHRLDSFSSDTNDHTFAAMATLMRRLFKARDASNRRLYSEQAWNMILASKIRHFFDCTGGVRWAGYGEYYDLRDNKAFDAAQKAVKNAEILLLNRMERTNLPLAA